MVRILVCGARIWKDYNRIEKVLNDFLKESENDKEGTITTIIQGECEGADKMAAKYAKKHNLQLLSFPADWSKGRKAGPIRNKQMLVEGQPDVVIGFHDCISSARGTLNMFRLSEKAKVPVYLATSSDFKRWKEKK